MGSTELDLERAAPADSVPHALPRVALTVALAAAGYYAGALAGFVQPLPAHGASSLWLANAWLLGVLLMTPWREWWAYVLAALAAHLLARGLAGLPPSVLSVEILSNLGQPVASAALIRGFVAPAGWFERFRETSWFIVIAGLLIPAAAALAAAAVLQSLGLADDFWLAWQNRYRADAVAVLTLTPVVVQCWARVGLRPDRPANRRFLEAGLLVVALALIGAMLLKPPPLLGRYELVLVYLPMPFFLWAAARFGLASLCSAMLVLGGALIWAAAHGAGVFSTDTLRVGGSDIDLYLIVSAIPLILLAVAFEEKRSVLRQVRISRENFQRLAESTAAIPWEADAQNWEFTYVGPQAAELLGLPIKRWLEGGFFGTRFHHDDHESVLAAFARIAETGEGADLQYRMTDAADRVVWVNDIVQAERRPDGGTRLRGFMVDVTERMRATHELQLMRERMAQASRISTFGELTASISHDLYQPLSAILHNAEVAEHLLSAAEPDMAEIRRIVADILDDDRRAREILRRMRSLMQSGQVVRERIDLVQLVRITLDLVAAEALIRSVRIEFVAEPVQIVVAGDAIHLQQLVMNLVLNAFDAVSVKPAIDRAVTVRLEKQDVSHCLLTVVDTGHGIPADAMSRLFEPFHTTKAEGLGIGLSITRRIVEAHGGHIHADNSQAGGARFRVRLPLAPGEPH